MPRSLLLLSSLILLSTSAHADPLRGGNILLSTDNVIYEVTESGEILQSFPVEHPTGLLGVSDDARDLAVSESGIIYLYNGTSTPVLSELNPADLDPFWIDTFLPRFNTVPLDPSFGGLAVFEDRVYLTDQVTDDDFSPLHSGVHLFDLGGFLTVSELEGEDVLDVNANPDGLVFVLSRDQDGRMSVDGYSPFLNALQVSYDLTEVFGGELEHRAIAVSASGVVYVADFDGQVHRFVPLFASAGFFVETISPTCADETGATIPCRFIDIDLTADGKAILGTADGFVVVLDADESGTVELAQLEQFRVGTRPVFVATVPESLGPQVVDIEIRTAQSGNRINPARLRNIWAVILSDESFDATTVDANSVRFGPSQASTNRLPRVLDIESDGDLDMGLRFSTRDTGVSCGDNEMTLTGLTLDGTEFTATAMIETTGC